MKKEMDLYAIYLPKQLSKDEIEQTLHVEFKKGIETTYYALSDETVLTFTQFNVLTMINCTKDEFIRTIEKLGIKDAKNFEASRIYEDYDIFIDDTLQSYFIVNNDAIVLKEYSIINLIIIAHVISQSVALEVYENKLQHYYEKSRKLINTANTYSIFKRTQLAKFSKELVLVRHDILIDLYLLDKPNILWDHEDAEMLYTKLSYILELKDRFDIVEYKLNNIKDDIVMVMDLTNHNHSSFLEWIIIILIFIEIIMGLMEFFEY